MTPKGCRIVVEPACWRTITDAALLQSGRETGGILLGWRHSTGVYVCDVVEVPDRRASGTQYLRRHRLASEFLDRFLDTCPARSPVGYVGEWHTHPAPQGPSRSDRRQLKQLSQHLHDHVALVVAVHDPHSGLWTPQGLCARSGRARPAHIDISSAQPDATTQGNQ